jgi:L-ascorbate metabolism protein UlaG (beta-lactamase superfamily)
MKTKPASALKSKLALALALGCTSLASTAWAAGSPVQDPRLQPPAKEQACRSLQLAATGGPTLRDPQALAVRWLGYSTFELVYGNKIILLDNYYDRGPRYRDLGFNVKDVQRADLILVGHAHHDHMSDTAQTAIQTGAPVVGAPVSIEKLASENVAPAQLRQVTGKGGELLKFDGFTVQPILGRHGEPDQPYVKKFAAVYAEAAPRSAADAAAEKIIHDKGSDDKRVVAEGTIAYVITFGSGFRLAYRDSGGTMTSYEKEAMQKIGPVDVLIGAIAASTIAEANAEVMLPMVRTYRPAVYIPAHHEQGVGNTVDRATEPMFQYIKNEFPKTVTVSKEFREPTCFDTRFNIQKHNLPGSRVAAK